MVKMTKSKLGKKAAPTIAAKIADKISAKSAVKNLTKKAGKDAGKNVGKKTSHKAVNIAAKKIVKKTAKKKSGIKSAVNLVSKSGAKLTTKMAPQKVPKNVIKTIAELASKKKTSSKKEGAKKTLAKKNELKEQTASKKTIGQKRTLEKTVLKNAGVKKNGLRPKDRKLAAEISLIQNAVPQMIKLVVTPEVAGHRLDKALANLAAMQKPELALSRARLQNLIEEGQVVLQPALNDGDGGSELTTAEKEVQAVNSAPAEQAELQLHPENSNPQIVHLRQKAILGDVWQITLPPPKQATPVAEKMSLDIVYEDSDLLVINKAAGMVVHPAAGNAEHTLVNALLAHCGSSLSGIGGVARPGIVHRLDKDTSGLMVVAKNDKAHIALSKQFADRSLSRVYKAFIWGHLVPMEGQIEAPIGRHGSDRKKMAVTTRGGKQALTFYKTLERYFLTHTRQDFSANPVSLVECVLATGRTHQIRVHLAHLKHPVIGDQTYGWQRFPKDAVIDPVLSKLIEFPRQALHAASLKFMHPRSGKEMRFSSEFPPDMKNLLALLKKKIV